MSLNAAAATIVPFDDVSVLRKTHGDCPLCKVRMPCSRSGTSWSVIEHDGPDGQSCGGALVVAENIINPGYI